MVRILLMLAIVAGCQTSAFVCQSDVQCGATGECEANGSCSFPDANCESGRRYGTHAADPGACVPTEETSTTEPASTSSGSGSSTSLTTQPDDSTTMAVSQSGTTSSSTSSTTDAPGSSDSTGVPVDPYDFEDDFERPDSAAVGNGWIEKTPAAFSLVDGGLRRTSGATSYPNNLVYRPMETWQDAEAVLTLRFDAVDPWGFPQFALRTQLDDIDVQGSVTGYVLFIESSGLLQITRQIGGMFTYEESADLAGPIVTGAEYRMRMRVMGTDPVVVDGYLEQQTMTGWIVHTEVHMIDDTVDQIAAPGTLALGAHDQLEAWAYEHIGLYDLAGM